MSESSPAPPDFSQETSGQVSPEVLSAQEQEQLNEAFSDLDEFDDGLGLDSDLKPRQIMEQLTQQQNTPSQTTEEKRQHVRRTWHVKLQLAIAEAVGGKYRYRRITVQTGDISSGGFSFYHGQFLYEKTSVAARFETLPNQPVLQGRICHCQLIDQHRYHVGVQFVQA